MLEHLKNLGVGFLCLGAICCIISILVETIYLLAAYPAILIPILLCIIAYGIGRAVRSS